MFVQGKEARMGRPAKYPPEFQREAVELVRLERPVERTDRIRARCLAAVVAQLGPPATGEGRSRRFPRPITDRSGFLLAALAYALAEPPV